MASVYDSSRWDAARSAALARDGHRCTVVRILGGSCRGDLHVHHLTPLAEGGAPYELDNLVTACASHHPMLERVRRAVLDERSRRREPRRRRCTHNHRYAHARAECEARLAALA